MSDWFIALLCFVAGLLQLSTVALVPLPLMRAAKRIAAVGLILGGVKYCYAAFLGLDLARVAVTAIPLVLISIASIMNGWSLIFEQHRYDGTDRRAK